ncbi:MAG: hypothetical protein J6Q54_02380 [Oscillospiraceae bacterium]|nr:hypothetical protein [Oscillospiraceae bacterium]
MEIPKENKGSAPKDAPEKKSSVWTWIYRLCSIILSVPVLVVAIILAIHNMNVLPEIIGLDMQSNGEYTQAITKGVAVMGPLLVTVVCTLLTICSKKMLYPWLISLFSLALPLVFMFTGAFM